MCKTESGVSSGNPVLLLIDGTGNPATERNYDITPGRQTVVVIFPASTAKADTAKSPTLQINVVLNWVEELKQRVPLP